MAFGAGVSPEKVIKKARRRRDPWEAGVRRKAPRRRSATDQRGPRVCPPIDDEGRASSTTNDDVDEDAAVVITAPVVVGRGRDGHD